MGRGGEESLRGLYGMGERRHVFLSGFGDALFPVCLSVGLSVLCIRESLATTCACTTRTRRGGYALGGISRTSATSTSCRRPPSGTFFFSLVTTSSLVLESFTEKISRKRFSQVMHGKGSRRWVN